MKYAPIAMQQKLRHISIEMKKKFNHDLNTSISSDTWCQQAAMCKNEETPDPKCNSFWRGEMQMNSPGEHLIVNR
jgi:hypothetical protein